MSQRQIGEVLGVGQKTVTLDLRGESNDSTARRTKRRSRPFLLPLSQMTQTRTRSRSSRRRPVTSRQAADDCFAVQVRATYERSRRSPKESSAAANAGSVLCRKAATEPALLLEARSGSRHGLSTPRDRDLHRIAAGASCRRRAQPWKRGKRAKSSPPTASSHDFSRGDRSSSSGGRRERSVVREFTPFYSGLLTER